MTKYIDNDVNEAETFAELDELTKKWQYSLRGLREVNTDDPGRKLIAEALSDMRGLYAYMRRLVAEQGWEITELHQALKLQGDRDWMIAAIRLKDEVIAGDAELIEQLVGMVSDTI